MPGTRLSPLRENSRMGTDGSVATAAGHVATRDYGGGGVSIVYLHGQGMNVGVWDAVADAVGTGFRQVAFDLPGHGESYDVDRWDWDEVGAVIAAVARAHDLESPVLVGHSLGGMAAIRYAAAGGPAAGIVDVDGWAGPPLPDLLASRSHLLEAQLAMMDTFAAPFDAMLSMQRNAASAQGLNWDAAEPMVRRMFTVDAAGVARFAKKADQTRAVLDAMRVESFDLRGDAAGLACPLHYVGAEQPNLPPGMAPPEGLEEARQQLLTWLGSTDGITIETLPCGHNIPLILPAELAAIIARTASRFAEDPH